MTDVSKYLQDILDAVYGEEVRGSIHDALEAFWNDLNDICLGADGYRYETPGDALRSQTQHIVDGVDEQIGEILDSYNDWYDHLRQEFITYRDALKHILNEGSMEEPVEVLQNGDFQDGFNGWVHPNSGMTIETDSDGKYVHCTAATQWGSFKQQFAFSEPGSYLISFKVKGSVTMDLVNNNWDRDIIGTQMYNTSYWAPISLPISVKSGQLLNCAIIFFHDGSSDWSVRDVSILQQASTLDTLANNINFIGLSVDEMKTQMDAMTYDAASFHNSIFRGKSLGNEITTAQKSAIHSGTFEDMYIGDYWSIDGVIYRIAHFNYYKINGPNAYSIPNHITLVPDTQINSSSYWPFSYTSENRSDPYGRSQLRGVVQLFGSTGAPPSIYYYFNDIAYKHDNYYPSGLPDNGSLPFDIYGTAEFKPFDGRYGVFTLYENSWIELMNEHMVFGSYMTSYTTDYIYTTGAMRQNLSRDNRQLALFALRSNFINLGASDYWLADTVGNAVCCVTADGRFGTVSVSSTNPSKGLRPYIVICGES